jgi:dipeptidyl aminopeptidase/acylaminoacyl peptidase
MKNLPLLLALLTGASAPATRAAETHPFNVRDLVSFRRVDAPSASPDGKQVVFTLRTTDLDANKGRTDLWVVNADGSGLKQLTATPESESNPLFSPDGKWIYFLSTRAGGPQQVFRMPSTGGDAVPVTQLPLDVGSFTLSRDGQKLLVSLDVFVDCGTLACTKERLDSKQKAKSSGQLYTQLFIRHWDEFRDGRRSHLFILPVSGGAPVDVMKGLDADSPAKPFGDSDDYAFTPDGKGVVFSANADGASEAWSTNFDLFLTKADGSGTPERLTAQNHATDTAPLFSPDGKQLVYQAMSVPGYESDRFRIMVRAWPNGPEREVAKAWDRSPHALAWSRDGKTLYAAADDLGARSLFAIDVASGKVRRIGHGPSFKQPVALAKGRVATLVDHLKSPAELYTLKDDGSGLKAITSFNQEALSHIRLGEPEQFSFTGAGGDTVYAWVVKPADYVPGHRYPVAFLIHGGPQGSFGNDFHYRWNPQAYAGAGYAAVMVDFHGSTGYGQKFTDAIGDDWGGKPLEDLQKGLAAAVSKYDFLDGDHACALGASYGGFMINYIEGAWPDRFKCLVAHDGNLDEQAAYFQTEELWFPEREHGGTPWDNPNGYQKHNPVNLVKNWKTPILVVHGGKDYRVVDTSGISSFTAAQRRGIPSEFLYFPDENHWVLKPQNSIQWHDTVLGWLDRWLKPGPASARTP